MIFLGSISAIVPLYLEHFYEWHRYIFPVEWISFWVFMSLSKEGCGSNESKKKKNKISSLKPLLPRKSNLKIYRAYLNLVY